MKNSFKNKIFLLLVLLATNCTKPVVQFIDKPENPEPKQTPVEQNDTEIRQDLETYINANFETSLVNELKNGSTSYPVQLSRAIQRQPDLCNSLLAVAAVQNQISLSQSFEKYINNVCGLKDKPVNVDVTIISSPTDISVQ